jgi:GNAT superfamily N-acetyltransferase
MTPEDFQFASNLSNTMNWNATIEDFELAINLEPDGCFVLLRDSKRVGVATTVSYGKMGWFGNLIVTDNCRRKGAGSLLTKHAVEYLRGKDVKTIGLFAYPHLVEFYEGLGFKKENDFSMLKGNPKYSPGVEPLERIEEAYFSSVTDFDSHCFGANRSKLIFPILLKKQNPCYIFNDHGDIKGFIAANVYDKMATIGPMVCVLDGFIFAQSLLKTVFNNLNDLQVFICVQRKQNALLSWLLSTGFQEDFRVSRMFLGSRSTPECIYLPESLERG